MQLNSDVVSMNARFSSGNFLAKHAPQFTFRNKSDFRIIVCEYCKKTGHNKDKCFKLHDFPNSRRNNETGNRLVASSQGNNAKILSAS